MGKVRCDIRIGTSGWHYDHWSGRFYPEDLPKSRWFLHYAQHFDTVEVNNTFYQLPKPKSVENWHRQAPDNYIKRLKDSEEPLARFFEIARLLKEKLGPVLYQLPPSMHKDLDRLETFIKLLPKKQPAVFEFRHESWFSDDTYQLLNKFNIGFCTHDLPGRPSPRVITGDLIYLRFHGTTGRYAGNYSKPLLKNWSDWIKDNRKGVRTVYAYFNNDYNAYAVSNAKTFKEHLLIG
jgi:uncharacterized protein YecE (DUF72 family)